VAVEVVHNQLVRSQHLGTESLGIDARGRDRDLLLARLQSVGDRA